MSTEKFRVVCLGLAITTEVCARCGWGIAFTAEVPRGLRVTLRGPIHHGTTPATDSFRVTCCEGRRARRP